MLGEVEGFSLALNYTAEDRRRQGARARKRERLKQRYTLSLLSFVSKQMSTRLFSLLQYKGLLTKTHTHRHAHTSSWTNQCILVSVISQGALLCPTPPWVSKVTKPAREERISYFLPSFFNLFSLVCFYSFLSAYLLFSILYEHLHNMQWSAILIQSVSICCRKLCEVFALNVRVIHQLLF